MLKKLHSYLKQQNQIHSGNRLILAVSGGIDSMVMLDLFKQLPFELCLAHCNFQLRGEESDLDEAMVRRIADFHFLPVFVAHFNTVDYAQRNNQSIQVAARELRYNWFKELRIETQSDWILTAHQADDHIETFFINLLRGSGIKGLGGVPERNEYVLRPMLMFTRKEIYAYAKRQNIEYREDASNMDGKYLRNKIRMDLVPVLRKLSGEELFPLRRSIRNVSEANSFYQDMMHEQIARITIQNNEHSIVLDKGILQKQIHCNLILSEFLIGKSFPSSTIQSVIQCLPSTEAKTFFSGIYKLVIERNEIHLMHYLPELDEELNINIFDGLQIDHPLEMEFSIIIKDQSFILSKDPNCAHLDADLAGKEIQFRKWKAGDRFFPLGMTNEQTLSDFFINSKYSTLKKGSLYLMLSIGRVAWIIGERIDHRFRVTDKTVKVLQIKLKSLE